MCKPCSVILMSHDLRYIANVNYSVTSVRHRNCSVYSIKNPSNTLKEQGLRLKCCARYGTVSSLAGIAKILFQQMPSRPKEISRTVFAGFWHSGLNAAEQLAHATKKSPSVAGSLFRVSTLLIRWSRVRVSPDPPVFLQSLRGFPRNRTVLNPPKNSIRGRLQLADAYTTVQTLFLGSVSGPGYEKNQDCIWHVSLRRFPDLLRNLKFLVKIE